MGLSHSKTHPRVTKVAPLQIKEEETPSPHSVDVAFHQNLEETSSYSFARLRDRDRNKALEGQLPPLRETWYGRYSAVPRTMYFDIPLEQGETSIIKRHPPRRLQKLEPIDLPQVMTSERILSQQEARTTHKAKQELEKKMQTPVYSSGKRQYLHKMQMLEMNRKRQEAQVELKKNHQEARINRQKLGDHKTNKILESIPRNDDEEDFLTFLPDETLDQSSRNSEKAEFLEHHPMNDCCPRKIGKMEIWLREQETRGQLLWDSSSSDSDELGKAEKKPRALVRTRTERIPLFDEFFDRQ
ncbi:coiled-coil domain containing 198 [Rhinolophus ferrumequinum]|uniref:Coiled-coil domain containing 198 n=1 Tax=Rhinolophus ferrumequinum TaxID=59479 RepID=A0A7J7XMP4_RHIFE|nr:coiled-coil domain containing 198 [Rhinolophus ferrumequinum]